LKNFTPYTIVHVDLSAGLGQVQNGAKASTYYIFWWGSLPLGQVFTSGKAPSQKVFLTNLTAAIEPAVTHYQKTKNLQKRGWKEALESGDEAPFISLMNDVYTAPKAVENTLPVSVVICTRNRPQSLETCLESLAKMNHSPAQIVVVDNAAEDNGTEKVASLFKQVTYVKEPKKGLDIARNTGVRNASQPIIAFVDDDVLVHPLWLANVCSTFDDEDIDAMTGLVLANSLNTEAQWIFEKYWGFNRGFVDVVYGPDYFKNTLEMGPPVWNIGAGANMAFRRSAFEKAGVFDERLDAGAAGCNGDSELWFRMLANGLTIHYNPRAVLFHEHRESNEALKSQIKAYMRGFTAACLFQQDYTPGAGYKKHLLQVLPKYYAKQLKKGFPSYGAQFQTVRPEITGMLSGWIFYLQNRKTPSNTGFLSNESKQ